MLPITPNLLDAAPTLKAGQLAVIPTDTIYGLVGSALDPAAVERLYEVRRRDPAKPCIILLSQPSDLEQFDIPLEPALQNALAPLWPGPVSVVLPCPSVKWNYLHRGTHSLAFRVPANAALRAFLTQAGPLLAPSANPEGSPPAATIAEAQAYFGAQVDIYVDGGRRQGKPSRLVQVNPDATIKTLR